MLVFCCNLSFCWRSLGTCHSRVSRYGNQKVGAVLAPVSVGVIENVCYGESVPKVLRYEGNFWSELMWIL